MILINKMPVWLLAAAAALPMAAQAGIQYAVTRIGPVGPYAEAVSINNAGVVAGNFYSLGDMGMRAFLWSNGGYSILPTGGAQGQYATGINQHGEVAMVRGELDIEYGSAYRYDQGVFTPLGRLKPGATSRAFGLNNNGAVVGDSGLGPDGWTTEADRHAFLYKDGKLTDLGTLGGSDSSAQAVNDAGTAAGFSNVAGDVGVHAFIYQNGQLTDIGTLGGDYSAARGINNAGAIVGGATTATGEQHAFLYRNGVMSDLGWLGTNTYALDVNEHGQVVGTASGGGAWLYSGGAMSNLASLIDPALGLTFQSASGINDLGQIVGEACDAAGDCSGVLLTPVPEPEGYAMLLAGLGLIGYTVRRRKGNAAV